MKRNDGFTADVQMFSCRQNRIRVVVLALCVFLVLFLIQQTNMHTNTRPQAARPTTPQNFRHMQAPDNKMIKHNFLHFYIFSIIKLVDNVISCEFCFHWSHQSFRTFCTYKNGQTKLRCCVQGSRLCVDRNAICLMK